MISKELNNYTQEWLAYYWVEQKVFVFSKRWLKQTKKFLQGRNWKACDMSGDGNSKQCKLHNWLNIVNIFKKNDWLFIWKMQKLSIQPNTIKSTYSYFFKSGHKSAKGKTMYDKNTRTMNAI
jgi:hypothetical protein